jgi:hypothetical protein
MRTKCGSNIMIDLRDLGSHIVTTKWDDSVKIDLRGTGNDNNMGQQC